MTDPDLTERIAAQYYESPYPDGSPQRLKWAEAHPDDRAHWRGVVATVTDLLDTDRARPWPRVGSIDPETLEQLDVRGVQAREAVEQ